MLILAASLLSNGYGRQNDQVTRELAAKLNFSPLWTQTANSMVLGFIGDNYQRIRIKFLSIVKSTNQPQKYLVVGKSKVGRTICRFSGAITITSIDTSEPMHFGADDEYKDSGIVKQGILTAKYHFSEDSIQAHSGVFEGTLSTLWYIDARGELRYDDIESYSDSYCNNQFIGTWQAHGIKKTKVCNWGDFRIPNASGYLDMGAGEFSPDEKYLRYGWQSYVDAWFKRNPEALREEESAWWK